MMGSSRARTEATQHRAVSPLVSFARAENCCDTQLFHQASALTWPPRIPRLRDLRGPEARTTIFAERAA